MADVVASTNEQVPVAAWMVQADPALTDIGTQLADSAEDDLWTWSCEPGARASAIAAGHPCMFWVTENDNPSLVPGIWLVGAAAAACEDGPTWNPGEGLPDEVPYLSMQLQTLATPVSRDELLAHPVLKDLEVLTAPDTPNPLVVTPDQLDALRGDFDLTIAPLSDELRDELSNVPPELWIAGDEETSIEVYSDDDGWSVWAGDDLVGEHDTWRAAYADACLRAMPDPPITEDANEPLTLAVLNALDGSIWIVRIGESEYEGYMEELDTNVAHAIEGTYETLDEAVLQFATGLSGEA